MGEILMALTPRAQFQSHSDSEPQINGRYKAPLKPFAEERPDRSRHICRGIVSESEHEADNCLSKRGDTH